MIICVYGACDLTISTDDLNGGCICNADTEIPLTTNCVCPNAEKEFAGKNTFRCTYKWIQNQLNLDPKLKYRGQDCKGHLECQSNECGYSLRDVFVTKCASGLNDRCYEFDENMPMCAGGMECTLNGCKNIPEWLCVYNSDCVNGLCVYTSGNQRACFNEICTHDSDCPSKKCNNGKCKKSLYQICKDHDDCGSGYCDLDLKACKLNVLASCGKNEECKTGTKCINGKCKLDIFQVCNNVEECTEDVDMKCDDYYYNVTDPIKRCILCHFNESKIVQTNEVETPFNCKDGKFRCFHSSSHFITLLNNQEHLIEGKDLRHNMLIKVGPSQYEPILYFGHFDLQIKTVMIQLQFEDLSTFTASAYHYIYTDAGIKMLHEIQLNETITNLKVINIRDVQTTGLINPYTYSGKVVVDGKVASCYTGTFNPTLAHFLVRLTYFIPGYIKTYLVRIFKSFIF